MAHDVELIVRNGLVVDGSGGAPFIGDVAMSGGRIVDIGPFPPMAARKSTRAV